MFADRTEAGERLAEKLIRYKLKKNGLVLAIPRGGVVVGKVVAQKLVLPLDVLVVRKIGAPGEEELALGAVGPQLAGKPVVVWDEDLCRAVGVRDNWRKRMVEEKSAEISLKIRGYRGNMEKLGVKGKVVILVDDGMATGATAEAAIKWLKAGQVKKVILAVPVAAKESWNKVSKMADGAVALVLPTDFMAVGRFYEDFAPVSDEEVERLLK